MRVRARVAGGARESVDGCRVQRDATSYSRALLVVTCASFTAVNKAKATRLANI